MNKLSNFVQINSEFTVCSQIAPDDIAEIVALGYKSIINNRPDDEERGQPNHELIAAEAKKHGIPYAYHPVVNNAFTEEQVIKMADLVLQLPQPIFAFCRSGARSNNIYTLAKQLIEERG